MAKVVKRSPRNHRSQGKGERVKGQEGAGKPTLIGEIWAKTWGKWRNHPGRYLFLCPEFKAEQTESEKAIGVEPEFGVLVQELARPVLPGQSKWGEIGR